MPIRQWSNSVELEYRSKPLPKTFNGLLDLICTRSSEGHAKEHFASSIALCAKPASFGGQHTAVNTSMEDFVFNLE